MGAFVPTVLVPVISSRATTALAKEGTTKNVESSKTGGSSAVEVNGSLPFLYTLVECYTPRIHGRPSRKKLLSFHVTRQFPLYGDGDVGHRFGLCLFEAVGLLLYVSTRRSALFVVFVCQLTIG